MRAALLVGLLFVAGCGDAAACDRANQIEDTILDHAQKDKLRGRPCLLEPEDMQRLSTARVKWYADECSAYLSAADDCHG